MITKSVRLTEAEADDLRSYVEASGEVEATVLKRAALRGLHEMKVERAILNYLGGMTSGQAAEAAGIPRATLLEALMDHGVKLLDGPSTLPEELAYLAGRLDAPGLAAVADRLTKSEE